MQDINIILLGSYGCGKTSFVKAYLGQEFNPEELPHIIPLFFNLIIKTRIITLILFY